MPVELLKVDNRTDYFVLLIICLLITPVFFAIYPLLVSISLFFSAIFLYCMRNSKYEIVILGVEKKFCKLFNGNRQECIDFDNSTQISLTTWHRHWKYVVAASTNDAHLVLIMTGNYLQAKQLAEKAATLAGASLSIEEPVFKNWLDALRSTSSAGRGDLEP